MTISPALYCFILGVEFVCYFIKGLAAFGDPLISNPVLSLAMDNKFISPMNLLLGTPINAYMAWKNRKAFTIKKTIPMLAAILCGVVPGIFLLKYATAWTLKAFLGVLVIGIGVGMLLQRNRSQAKRNPLTMIVASFFSGMTAGLYGINLFFVAYVERTTETREAFRGNVCFIFLVENLFRIVAYTVSGILTPGIVIVSIMALPGALLGFFAGSKVDKHLNEQTIRRIIILMFISGGISILIKAVVWKS